MHGPCLRTKIISIELDTYEKLAAPQKPAKPPSASLRLARARALNPKAKSKKQKQTAKHAPSPSHNPPARAALPPQWHAKVTAPLKQTGHVLGVQVIN